MQRAADVYKRQVGELPDDSECAALRGLAAEFGVGVLCLEIADERLGELLSLIHILVIPMGESCLYEIRLAAGTKTRPQTAEYFFRNRVSQQAPLADGAYKIHIPRCV